MEWKRGVLCALALGGALETQAAWVGPFISELHYDNAGTDTGEFVAVTAPSGLSLEGWSLVLYNGTDGRPYRTLALGGIVDATLPGWSERYWNLAGLQNGPDGLALVDAEKTLVDVVAYGALFDLVEGPARGAAARLLPVAENSQTPAGWSLQRSGRSSEWIWTAALASPGALNPGLHLAATGRVPAAGIPLLLVAGGLGWALSRRSPDRRLA